MHIFTVIYIVSQITSYKINDQNCSLEIDAKLILRLKKNLIEYRRLHASACLKISNNDLS